MQTKTKTNNNKRPNGATAKTPKKAAAQSTSKVNGNGINTDGMSKADISTLRAWEMLYEKRGEFIK